MGDLLEQDAISVKIAAEKIALFVLRCAEEFTPDEELRQPKKYLQSLAKVIGEYELGIRM